MTNSAAFPEHRHCRRVVPSTRLPPGGLPRRVHGPFPSPISYRGGGAQRRHNPEQPGHRHNIGSTAANSRHLGGSMVSSLRCSDIPGLGKGRQKGQASPLVLDGDGVARCPRRLDQVPLSDRWGQKPTRPPLHATAQPSYSRAPLTRDTPATVQAVGLEMHDKRVGLGARGFHSMLSIHRAGLASCGIRLRRGAGGSPWHNRRGTASAGAGGGRYIRGSSGPE